MMDRVFKIYKCGYHAYLHIHVSVAPSVNVHCSSIILCVHVPVSSANIETTIDISSACLTLNLILQI